MYKNYIQFQGNFVVAFSSLIEFPEGEVPLNLMEAGGLTADNVRGKYYNPADRKFYDNYDFKTGEYSNN